MAAPAPEVTAYCDELKADIKRLGTKAFGLVDVAVLYSGPSYDIKAALDSGVDDNFTRSIKQAKRLGATRIDETYIGQLLGDADISEYFERIFGPGEKEKIKAAVFEVWAFASREYVKSGFRHVATAVCGADPERVFRAHELKVLLTEKTAVETINGVALQHYKDIYASHSDAAEGFYAAYVEMCRTELTQAEHRARNENTVEAWEDFNSRKLFFDLEQMDTKAKTALAAMTATHSALTAMGGPSPPASHTRSPHSAAPRVH